MKFIRSLKNVQSFLIRGDSRIYSSKNSLKKLDSNFLESEIYQSTIHNDIITEIFVEGDEFAFSLSSGKSFLGKGLNSGVSVRDIPENLKGINFSKKIGICYNYDYQKLKSLHFLLDLKTNKKISQRLFEENLFWHRENIVVLGKNDVSLLEIPKMNLRWSFSLKDITGNNGEFEKYLPIGVLNFFFSVQLNNNDLIFFDSRNGQLVYQLSMAINEDEAIVKVAKSQQLDKLFFSKNMQFNALTKTVNYLGRFLFVEIKYSEEFGWRTDIKGTESQMNEAGVIPYVFVANDKIIYFHDSSKNIFGQYDKESNSLKNVKLLKEINSNSRITSIQVSKNQIYLHSRIDKTLYLFEK